MRILPRRPLLALAALLLALTARPAHADGPRVVDALRPSVDDHRLAGAVVLVAGPDSVLSPEAKPRRITLQSS